MARSIRTGEAMTRGFTLLELLVVLFIVALLASIVGPTVTSGIQRSKEATLREDLRVMRKALDDHYGDTGTYPPALDALVEKRYLRNVPVDPVTGSSTTWTFEMEDSQDSDGEKTRGVRDVHSGAEGQGRDGTSYTEW
jgi:general secretion pathway protein G